MQLPKRLPGLLAPDTETPVRLPALMAKPECPRGLSDAARMDILVDHIIWGGSSNSGVPISFGDRRRLGAAMAKDPRLRAEYENAMWLRADALAEEIILIADTETDPQRAKVMVAARTWWAAKINPRKYSDRVEIGLTGEISITAALIEARARVRTLDAEIVESPPLPGPLPGGSLQED